MGTNRPRTLLFVGEKPERSAGCLTLARALQTVGITVEFSPQIDLNTRHWMRKVRNADALIFFNYTRLKLRRARQLALAAVQRPILRFWVGSDVLFCLEQEDIREWNRTMAPFVAANLANAPHLVEELATIGISARLVPPNMAPSRFSSCGSTSGDSDSVPKSLLVYLPENRIDFYGGGIVRQAIEANPDITFVIVADSTHHLAGYPNVRSLGWVEDMDAIWDQIGGLLRITQHDGMPRMVVECLARGKYAIYSWPLPGCWYARTDAELQQKLDAFRHATGPNHAGVAAARQLLPEDGPAQIASIIERAIRSFRIRHRVRSALSALSMTARLRVQGER